MQTRLSRLLYAIEIEVMPYIIADSSRNIIACIESGNGIATLHGERQGHAAHIGIGIAVYGIIAPHIIVCRHISTGRSYKSDLVSSRRQIAEHVHAGAVGCRSRIDWVA